MCRLQLPGNGITRPENTVFFQRYGSRSILEGSNRSGISVSAGSSNIGIRSPNRGKDSGSVRLGFSPQALRKRRQEFLPQGKMCRTRRRAKRVHRLRSSQFLPPGCMKRFESSSHTSLQVTSLWKRPTSAALNSTVRSTLPSLCCNRRTHHAHKSDQEWSVAF